MDSVSLSTAVGGPSDCTIVSICQNDPLCLPMPLRLFSVLLHQLLRVSQLISLKLSLPCISMTWPNQDGLWTPEHLHIWHRIQDMLTHRVLLRCENHGDLYLVTTSTPTALFSVSPTTWHHRLGHHSSDVLCHLIWQKFISRNKEKSPVLCHACQLGKYVRLSFPVLSQRYITGSER